MFSLSNGTPIPKCVSLYILSFLDDKDLTTVEQLDKRGQALASNPTLWENLFKRVFQQEPPEGMSTKEAFIRRKVSKICKFKEISKIYTNFICDLEWDKKRILEIKIPEDGLLLVEENYGSQCETQEIFYKNLPVFRNCFRCYDIVYDSYDEHNRDSSFTVISEKKPSFYTNPKIHSKTTLKTFHNSSLIDLINIKKTSSPFQREIFRNVSIENVDVGFGNSLAYFSALNDWKKPFKLFCVVFSDKPRWVGRLPGDDAYKFVKIDSEGKITWENLPAGNRVINSGDRYYKTDTQLNNPQIEFPQ